MPEVNRIDAPSMSDLMGFEDALIESIANLAVTPKHKLLHSQGDDLSIHRLYQMYLWMRIERLKLLKEK